VIYDLASLAGKCVTTPPFGFWEFEPYKIVGSGLCINTPKGTSLGGNASLKP